MESILVNIVFGCILRMGKVVSGGIKKKWCWFEKEKVINRRRNFMKRVLKDRRKIGDFISFVWW